MYLEHFGLRDFPFALTPDTRRFFPGAGREESLKTLLTAIHEGEGLMQVVGAAGTGKTMLCRTLCQRVPKNHQLALLLNPDMAPESLLPALLHEFRLTIHERVEPWNARQVLLNHLLVLNRNGQRALLMVDEAHRLPAETLEELRLLGNLETGHAKLLQVILFSQRDFGQAGKQPEVRQLLERVVTRIRLKPLNHLEIAHYLHARLVASGYEREPLFTPLAARSIHLGSAGRLHRIHRIAHLALGIACEEESAKVRSIHVWRALANDTPFHFFLQGYRPLMTGTILTAILVAGTVPRYLNSTPHAQTELPTEPIAIAQPMTSPQPVTRVQPALGMQPTSGVQHLPDSQPNAAGEKPQTATMTTAPQPSPRIDERALSTSQQPERMVSRPGPMRLTEANAPVAQESKAIKHETIARKQPTPSRSHAGGTGNIPYLKEDDPLGEAIIASHRWLEKGDDSHYTIQLMLIRSEKGLQQLADQLAAIQPPPGEIDLKLFRLKDDALLVHLNECATAVECEALMNRLPVVMRANHPSVRSLARLKTTVRKLALLSSDQTG
ncbi:MAG: AAA family ATPase [Magnetococcus sp. YQC-9]